LENSAPNMVYLNEFEYFAVMHIYIYALLLPNSGIVKYTQGGTILKFQANPTYIVCVM